MFFTVRRVNFLHTNFGIWLKASGDEQPPLSWRSRLSLERQFQRSETKKVFSGQVSKTFWFILLKSTESKLIENVVGKTNSQQGWFQKRKLSEGNLREVEYFIEFGCLKYFNFPNRSWLESAMLNKKLKLKNGLKQFWDRSSHQA